MEMEAALPSAKRSRRESPEETNPPQLDPADSGAAPSCDPPVEPEQSRGQEPAPPEAGGDGSGGDAADRISRLPDAILGELVSLLSTKEAARTQVLASRWRNVWCAAPLVLDATDLEGKGGPWFVNANKTTEEALAGVVSRILSTHPGPCRRLRVQPWHLYDRRDAVDAWLRSPALDNLQELDFRRGRRYWERPEDQVALPPESTFRFCATLHVATFSNFQLLDDTVKALYFPKLRYLALVEVRITEGSLHTMISSCPALECLLLDNSFGFECLRISCSRLRSIAVGADYYYYKPKLHKLVIVDAPCLERLLYLREHMGLRVSVISAPKLVTLGCLSDQGRPSCETVFGTTAIKGLHIRMVMVVPCIKILAVKSWDLTLDMVVDLMKCFPCLEKLYIKCRIAGAMNLWRRKHQNFIRSFDIRLKTIVFEKYQGIKSQVNFASFFVLNARWLELIRLEVEDRDYNEAFFAEQHRMLQMENRPSRGARLHFTTDRCRCSFVHVNHVRDLSITDPFECRC